MNQAIINRVGATILSFVFVAMVAFSWLVFPYFINGDRMMFETGRQVQNERFDDFRTLNRMLTRFIGLAFEQVISLHRQIWRLHVSR